MDFDFFLPRKGFFMGIKIFYILLSKDSRVEKSESIDGFSKFLEFEFLAEERFEQRKRIEYNSFTEFQ